ncbi:hypothetical protein KAR91_18910 [Candidatus Pacearchaeota archaeon]|nr:hypothetical protein [Candidatus Pacearchaeota archaeon]
MCLYIEECERHTTLCGAINNNCNNAPNCFVKIFEATESPTPLGQTELALLDAMKAAFIQGAKWWEYESTGATMWPGDQDRALAAAIKRAKDGTLGKIIDE